MIYDKVQSEIRYHEIRGKCHGFGSDKKKRGTVCEGKNKHTVTVVVEEMVFVILFVLLRVVAKT